MLVEPEYKVNGNTDDEARLKVDMMYQLAGDRGYASRRYPFYPRVLEVVSDSALRYLLFKRFDEPFRILGITLRPFFPTEDWNYPSPEILIYRRS